MGHRSFYAMNALVVERYWWLFMGRDIAWYVRMCHLCQVRQIWQIVILLTVATPAPLFTKMYMDTMHLTCSSGFTYIVQGRCSLSHYPEFQMLWKETAQSIGDWIFQNILCHWGTLVEIISDNGKPFIAALSYIEQKYHIRHIQISSYNSHANGIVEQSHFNVWQALYKASDGVENKWSQKVHLVFWSEHITAWKQMGYLPYFAVTGTHPLLPFDIVEANYLLPPPDSLLSTTDLIVCQAIALQKWQEDLARLKGHIHEAQNHAVIIFEWEHATTMHNFNFQRRALVLIRNTVIEKVLNQKMQPCYLRPMIVVSRN